MEVIFRKVRKPFLKSVKNFSHPLLISIWKVALKVKIKESKLIAEGSGLQRREVKSSPANLRSRIIQKAKCFREKFEEKKLEDVVVERQRTKRVTWKTRSLLKEGERFYLPVGSFASFVTGVLLLL